MILKEANMPISDKESVIKDIKELLNLEAIDKNLGESVLTAIEDGDFDSDITDMNGSKIHEITDLIMMTYKIRNPT